MKRILTILLLMIPIADSQNLGPYPVTRVIDGDTFVVNLLGIEERVRLIGVDTAELRLKQPGAQEAADYLEEQLRWRQVRLELGDQSRDRYGRILAYAFIDGADVGLDLLMEGHAAPLTIPPNVKRVDDYRAAAAGARSVSKGIWGEGAFKDHNCSDFATQREAQLFFQGARTPSRPAPPRP